MKEIVLAACVLVALAAEPPVVQEDEEESEREITLKEVPEAARVVILQEAGEHPVLEVDEVVIEGEIYYEAEWIEEDEEVEIRVAPDGTIAGRETEHSENEDAEESAGEKEAD